MANVTPVSVSVFFLILIDIVLCVVSFLTDYWSEMEITIGSIESRMNRGLIEYCTDLFGCKTYENEGVPGYIRGTLAGMVLAFLFNLAALVTVILWILHIGAKSTAKLLKVIAIILLAIAVFWYFIAIVVFADNDNVKGNFISRTDFSPSWSWGIAIIAGLLDILIAVAVVFLERRFD